MEDEPEYAETLSNHIHRYMAEHKLSCAIDSFSDGVEFLSAYTPIYDIVFMDIQLPHINGFEAAQGLRQVDPAVRLVFVTSFSQFAPKGYEVDASGFLVKPVTYLSFMTLMDRLMRTDLRDRGQEIVVHLRDGIRVIPYAQLIYIEISGHNLKYVTESGIVEASGSMAKLEEMLPGDCFARPSNSFLVHLKFVEGISGNTVRVGGTELPISRARKKDFVMDVMRYFGGRI